MSSSAETEVRATRFALLPGLLLVAWASGFSFFKADLSPPVYWTLLVTISVLVVAVPSWLFGRREKRRHLESQKS